MGEIFSISFLENIKVFIVAILIYVIIYALLKTIKPLGEDSKVNTLIALLTATIVSFSGVVTYAITYAINWFIIIFFIVFLLLVLLLFLGVKPSDITTKVSGKTTTYIIIAFFLLFSIIIIKSFFALNNTFDTNNPQDDKYLIDTSANTGVDDFYAKENPNPSFWSKLNVNSDLISAVLFLIGIGIFVIIMGR